MDDYDKITDELDLQAPSSDQPETKDQTIAESLSHGVDLSMKISNQKAIFLVFRSLVGIGILTIPKQI